MRRLAAFTSDHRGATALLTALCLLALMASAAVGVDLGDIGMRSRQLQGVADLAAMAAVQGLDPSAGASPQAAAAATAALNPWAGGITAKAASGVYTADPTLGAGQRFIADAANPNAVQVSLTAPVSLYFAGLIIGRSTLTIARTAVAARAQYAAFSIGSGLASLNGGVANSLLSALTGSRVQLSVMDDEALASANVNLLNYIPAVESRARLTTLSYDQLLSTAIAPSVALGALADTLSASGATAAAAAAQTLAAASTGLAPTPLSALFDLGPYAAQDHTSNGSGAAISVSAFGLADALLIAANGGRQLSLSLDGALPGITKLSVTLAVGQRPNHSPWLTVTDAGQVVVRTAQMRLYLDAGLAPGPLSTVTGGALVDLPVYVEAASAQARLLAIECPAGIADQGFDLSVSPSLGSLAIGQVDPGVLANFAVPVAVQPATLLNAMLVRVTASGSVAIGGGQASWQTVHFTQADVAAGTMKSVFTNDIARASVASLLASTNVQVQTPLGALGVTSGTVSPLMQALLLQAAPPLDGLIGQIEALSGVRLGEADVWANGLRCRGSALVA